MINRPALRYYGGKWRLAPWILEHFPPHRCYVEPFCGAASVFFRKYPSMFEVLNDADGEVVNFFQVLREETDELIYAILATPYSRQEYDEAWMTVEEPLERARRYYIRAWQGWGGGKGSKPSGWRYQHSNNRGKSVVADWNQVEHLPAIVQRLKKAFIENDDALDIVDRYDQPHTLFYLDPPYLEDTRTHRWGNGAYRYEISNEYHEQLLERLQDIQGMAIISGYPSPMYNIMLRQWKRLQTESRTTNTAKIGPEVIWLSPSITQLSALPLFAAGGQQASQHNTI